MHSLRIEEEEADVYMSATNQRISSSEAAEQATNDEEVGDEPEAGAWGETRVPAVVEEEIRQRVLQETQTLIEAARTGFLDEVDESRWGRCG